MYVNYSAKIQNICDISQYIAIFIAVINNIYIMKQVNIAKMRKSLGLTQSEFRKKIDISQSYLSELENGKKNLTEEQYDRIVSAFGNETVNAFIINDDEIISDDRQYSSKKLIPFFDDVSTIGGYNDKIADVTSNRYISEWIDTGDWFPEATSAIRHFGDSMVEYPSGCILVLKRVYDWRLIMWGRNYVIETTEFRITKRLQDGGDDYIIAYSSNQETYTDGTLIHSPIKIPKETIRSIDLVIGCVTKEYSNAPIQIIK